MIRIGEPVFRSVQGEGIRTGVLSIWVRFFGCNLECNGFMQDHPNDKSSWELPQFIDASMYKSIKDLPVFEKGCDSGYSWSKKFKHLATTYKDADEFYRKEINDFLYRSTMDGRGSWINPFTKNEMDLCFTGGEPMLWQKQIVDIYQTILEYGNGPRCIQIETNGTQSIGKDFLDWYKHGSFQLCWNISPKLLNVAGEKPSRAWKPHVIKEYYDLNPYGHLKFVMNADNRSWTELDQRVAELRDMGVDFPVYVMPVGATKDQQENSSVISQIANIAIQKGYHVSGRLHAIIWKNTVGV
jgi:6-pyruvoyltetrahydropterin 2'-reductase